MSGKESDEAKQPEVPFAFYGGVRWVNPPTDEDTVRRIVDEELDRRQGGGATSPICTASN